MKLKEIGRRIGRNLEALAHAFDEDPCADLRLRVDRLERLMADLEKTPEIPAGNR